MKRPYPSAGMLSTVNSVFVPAPELTAWMRETFIDEEGDLHNPDHLHLADAEIGCLWTNVSNTRAQRRIVGQCEVGEPRGATGKWSRERAKVQVLEWFEDIPDFILTFDANYAAACDDAEFCALVEHEMYHAAQEFDQYGQPKFTREGRPVFAIRGHDVEEFVGVVRRYGAIGANVSALVDAANRGPEIASIRAAQVCGTCALRAA